MATFSRGFLSQLGQPAMSQSLFNLGSALGSVPGAMKAKRKREEIAGIDLKTSTGLTKLATYYQSIGDLEKAAEVATAATQLKMSEDQQTAFETLKGNLGQRAKKIGLDEIANNIANFSYQDRDLLVQVASELRQEEIKNLAKNPATRKALALNLGLVRSAEEFEKRKEEFMAMTEEGFASLVTGAKGELKAFETRDPKDGTTKIKTFRVNDAGLVFDEAKFRFVQPNEAGIIKEAPKVTKVENIASGMADELAKVGAKNFADLFETAKAAGLAVDSIDQTFPNIDNMFIGKLADVKLSVSKFAKTFGLDLSEGKYAIIDYDTISDTEVFIARAADRVAQYIKNLGAGTGLSDADREYSEKATGGLITLDAKSLKRLLTDLRKGAVNKIETYMGTKEKLNKSLGGNRSALDFFPDIVVKDPSVPMGRDAAVNEFLKNVNNPD